MLQGWRRECAGAAAQGVSFGNASLWIFILGRELENLLFWPSWSPRGRTKPLSRFNYKAGQNTQNNSFQTLNSRQCKAVIHKGRPDVRSLQFLPGDLLAHSTGVRQRSTAGWLIGEDNGQSSGLLRWLELAG